MLTANKSLRSERRELWTPWSVTECWQIQSCAGNHRNEYDSHIMLGRQYHNTLTLPPALTFFLLLLWWSLNLGVDDRDGPLRDEHSTVTYSQLLDQLRVSAVTTDHCRKLSWPELIVSLICGQKHKYLESILTWTSCSFSKTAVPSLLGHMALGHRLMTRCEFSPVKWPHIQSESCYLPL